MTVRFRFHVQALLVIVPNDSNLLKQYLVQFKNSGFVPPALKYFDLPDSYLQSRYDSTIKWIEQYNHAVISNGPFYLKSYSPESRTIAVESFDDESYPFEAGHWKKFENVRFPKIVQVDIPDVITQQSKLSIPIKAMDASKINYFFTNSEGQSVASGIQSIDSEKIILSLSEEEANKLTIGANDLKVFAVSDSVLRPDIYTASFLVSSDSSQLPEFPLGEITSEEEKSEYISIISITLGVIIVGTILYLRHARKKSFKIKN